MVFHRLRMSAVTAFLPMFWICVHPLPVFAQAPIVEVPPLTVEPAIPSAIDLKDSTALTYEVGEERFRDRFVRYFTEGEWYFSYGLSRETWSPSNIRISQPSLGSNFTIYDVRGNDNPSYQDPFAAQYNIRIGRFIDDAHTLAVEFNFDHTRYEVTPGQDARVAGTIAGKPIDAQYQLANPFFSYRLANGANHAMVNLVKRVPLWRQPHESFSIAAIGKVGLGVMLPHSDNVIMGQQNDMGTKELGSLLGFHRGWWQIDGFTTGVEAGFRIGLTKRLFFEITDKVTYVHLGDINVYQGTARQNIWMNEVIFSLGVTFGKY
jgi:hypothetical protein